MNGRRQEVILRSGLRLKVSMWKGRCQNVGGRSQEYCGRSLELGTWKGRSQNLGGRSEELSGRSEEHFHMHMARLLMWTGSEARWAESGAQEAESGPRGQSQEHFNTHTARLPPKNI